MAVSLSAPPERRFAVLVDGLREAILTGRYRSGERLVQDELASAFGVSRIPLREALRLLEGEGLVVISPNRGAMVRPLIPKDVVDLFDVRLVLESLALREAAERYADLRDATAGRDTLARHASGTGAVATLFHLDRDFHADLAAASNNAHLIAILDGQWSQIMRLMHAYLRGGAYVPEIWRDHEEIAFSVAHGDGEAAVARLQTHLLYSRDRILTQLRADA